MRAGHHGNALKIKTNLFDHTSPKNQGFNNLGHVLKCCLLLARKQPGLKSARVQSSTLAAGFAFNMLHAVDVPRAVPLERWDVEGLQATPEVLQGNSLRFAAFLSDASQFDSKAYRMASGEAVGLDPQTRLLLEQTHAAMQVRPLAGCLMGYF